MYISQYTLAYSCLSFSVMCNVTAVLALHFITQALEKKVDDLKPGVQKLKNGKYHDVEKVDKRVESLASRLRLLGPRLKEASLAVDEAQAVVAMETSLDELEVWLVTCGKFSNNQHIVSEIEEHKVHIHVHVFAYLQ